MQLGTYRHTKTGRMYRVHMLAKHSETQEDMVVYEALYENPVAQFWVRPRALFESMVDVDGKKVPRFVCINETKL